MKISKIVLSIPLVGLLVALGYLIGLSFGAFREIDFGEIIINSIALGLASVFLVLVISLPAAKILGTYEFKGKKLFKLIFLLPLVISLPSISMGLTVVYLSLGISGSFFAVLSIHVFLGLPYGILLLEDGYRYLKPGLLTEAKRLGASSMQVFTEISLPLLLPSIGVVSMLVLAISFSEYLGTALVGSGLIKAFATEMFPLILNGEKQIGAAYSVVYLAVLGSILFIGKILNTKYWREKKDV